MPKSEAGLSTVVVVDRKVTGQAPAYHVAAITLCARCAETVWLGTATVRAVTGGAKPLCVECAIEVVPPGSEKVGRAVDRPRRRRG